MVRLSGTQMSKVDGLSGPQVSPILHTEQRASPRLHTEQNASKQSNTNESV